MVDEFHGRVCPPHCIARKRQHIEQIMSTIPPRSIVFSLSRSEFEPLSRSSVRGSSFRNIDNNAMTTPPMGTLLFLR